jgi:hypothetical protein
MDGGKSWFKGLLSTVQKNYHCVLQISQNTYLKTKSFHCCEIEEGGGDWPPPPPPLQTPMHGLLPEGAGALAPQVGFSHSLKIILPDCRMSVWAVKLWCSVAKGFWKLLLLYAIWPTEIIWLSPDTSRSCLMGLFVFHGTLKFDTSRQSKNTYVSNWAI